MCPQMSPFVLICPITVPISANSNPSVGGFLFALANSKVCSKQLEILSAALNALPGRSRDRVTPKS